jgi:hypothetical protein
VVLDKCPTFLSQFLAQLVAQFLAQFLLKFLAQSLAQFLAQFLVHFDLPKPVKSTLHHGYWSTSVVTLRGQLYAVVATTSTWWCESLAQFQRP